MLTTDICEVSYPRFRACGRAVLDIPSDGYDYGRSASREDSDDTSNHSLSDPSLLLRLSNWRSSTSVVRLNSRPEIGLVPGLLASLKRIDPFSSSQAPTVQGGRLLALLVALLLVVARKCTHPTVTFRSISTTRPQSPRGMVSPSCIVHRRVLIVDAYPGVRKILLFRWQQNYTISRTGVGCRG